VKEFLLEVSADVALLLWADELSGAHGDGGRGNSSAIGAGLLRPNMNPRLPSFVFAGSLVAFSLLTSCFLPKRPMLMSQGRKDLEKTNSMQSIDTMR
jgi:hypothetical protein